MILISIVFMGIHQFITRGARHCIKRLCLQIRNITGIQYKYHRFIHSISKQWMSPQNPSVSKMMKHNTIIPKYTIIYLSCITIYIYIHTTYNCSRCISLRCSNSECPALHLSNSLVSRSGDQVETQFTSGIANH